VSDGGMSARRERSSETGRASVSDRTEEHFPAGYGEAPPVGEEVHLPRPTILPLITAVAITLVVIGTTITWIFSAVGGVVLIVCIVHWIRTTREDVAALPEEYR
jgi:hypothetical protein